MLVTSRIVDLGEDLKADDAIAERVLLFICRELRRGNHPED
ncbi:MAG: hypothetical protein V3U03_17360 [Myxococcota bacterium]